MQRGWLLCQPFIFLHLCKSSQYRIVAFFRLLHQYTVYSLRCLPPRLLSEPTLFDLIRQDGQPFSGAACFPHFYGCKTLHDNRSPYFFSCSPTVHCRMQNWWAYFFPRVFRKCDFKKQPSQYVFNISSTSRMSCFLSIFIPSFFPPAFPSALHVHLSIAARLTFPGIPLSKFPRIWACYNKR